MTDRSSDQVNYVINAHWVDRIFTKYYAAKDIFVLKYLLINVSRYSKSVI